MVTNTLINSDQLAHILLTTAPLSANWSKALKAEIDNDPAGLGYAGLKPIQILALLNTTYSVTTPGNATTRNVSMLDSATFKKLRAELFLSWFSIEDKEIFMKAEPIVTGFLAILAEFEKVDLTDAKISGQFQALRDLGVLTQDIDNKFFVESEGGEDKIEYFPSRVSQLFGPMFSLELSDVLTAMGA